MQNMIDNTSGNTAVLGMNPNWVPSSEYEITELNKCAYDSFAIHIKRTQDSVITDETVFDWDEYILFKIFIGAMYASQAVTQYLDVNTLKYSYVDNDWDKNAKKFDFFTKPCIQIRRFYGTNPPSGKTARSLIQ